MGATLHTEEHYTYLEGVIPNSKVAIWPPNVRDGQIQGDWKRELYLRPGQWIPLVTLTVVLATGLMAIIVLVLHLNEKVCHPSSSVRIQLIMPNIRGKISWSVNVLRISSISMHSSMAQELPRVPFTMQQWSLLSISSLLYLDLALLLPLTPLSA